MEKVLGPLSLFQRESSSYLICELFGGLSFGKQKQFKWVKVDIFYSVDSICIDIDLELRQENSLHLPPEPEAQLQTWRTVLNLCTLTQQVLGAALCTCAGCVLHNLEGTSLLHFYYYSVPVSTGECVRKRTSELHASPGCPAPPTPLPHRQTGPHFSPVLLPSQLWKRKQTK